jgi:serine/threonine protein kinase
MTPIGDGALTHLTRTLGEFDLIHPRYQIDGLVASGGMGTVYRALDRRLSREVAIKVLRSIDAPPDFAERLIREAAILGKLDHPGLVPVHDVGTFEDGRPFYVMRLVRGERLDRHLETVTSLTERLRVFLKVTEPVAFAHAQGVVHRDLKPANIMVGPFGEVLVLDWGIAKIRGGDAEPLGAVLGTAGFMAPEQASGGSGAADERADVYALGAILGVILATSDRAAPRPLVAVRDRAMAERPSERYPSVVELAADVSRYLDGLPVQAYREPAWERAGRYLRRHRIAIALVAAYLVMRFLVMWFGGS